MRHNEDRILDGSPLSAWSGVDYVIPFKVRRRRVARLGVRSASWAGEFAHAVDRLAHRVEQLVHVRTA